MQDCQMQIVGNGEEKEGSLFQKCIKTIRKAPFCASFVAFFAHFAKKYKQARVCQAQKKNEIVTKVLNFLSRKRNEW